MLPIHRSKVCFNDAGAGGRCIPQLRRWNQRDRNSDMDRMPVAMNAGGHSPACGRGAGSKHMVSIKGCHPVDRQLCGPADHGRGGCTHYPSLSRPRNAMVVAGGERPRVHALDPLQPIPWVHNAGGRSESRRLVKVTLRVTRGICATFSRVSASDPGPPSFRTMLCVQIQGTRLSTSRVPFFWLALTRITGLDAAARRLT